MVDGVRRAARPFDGSASSGASAPAVDPWLIFLDIDGTLVDDTHRPRSSATRAVRQARARGHRVYLSTGRSRSGISDEIMEIGFDGVVTASGGFIETAEALIATETMPEADVSYLIDLFASLDLEFTLQARDRTYASIGLADRMRPLLLEQRRLAAGGVSALAHLEQLEERFVYAGPPPLVGIAKATFVGLDALAYGRLCDAIEARFLPVTGTIPYLGELGGEVGLRTTNKGRSLRRVAEFHGIPMRRTMAVGDSANDLEMITEAAVGVAMGDAPPTLIETADFTTGTVAEDGIWRAFVRYGLVDDRG
ncbi:HAD family hydrolase [Leucobacter sp. gxy201]|uniref:HAD hydrolase family protein n=1 Tax=Leucobacter sp. gxy201 TaxID=2957200 RepID=UPI003DA15373